jgi:pimeloyl-ACP methyl ester carboxylesterase
LRTIARGRACGPAPLLTMFAPPPVIASVSNDGHRVFIRDVSARGARVRFAEAGDGPPLLLIHGYLSSRLAWEDAMPALANHFHVVVPDLPGFGESEKPPPERYAYTFDSFAESLVDLIAALGLSRVHVCGHSLGGAIALTMAANHPDVVDKLILVGSLVYPSRMDVVSRVATVPMVGAVLFKQLYGRALFRSYFRKRVYGTASSAQGQRVDQLFDLFNTPAGREAAYATMVATLDTRPLVAKIPRVTAPTLVGWGRADKTYPVAHGRRLARELRSARFEVFECGHSPPEECADPFAKSATAFLRDNHR